MHCITFQKIKPSICFKCFKIRIFKSTIRKISSAISTTFLHVGICVRFLVKKFYEFGHFPKKRINGKTMKLATTFKHQHLASLITLALNFDQVMSLFQLRNVWIRRYMKCDTSYTTNWFYIKKINYVISINIRGLRLNSVNWLAFWPSYVPFDLYTVLRNCMKNDIL